MPFSDLFTVDIFAFKDRYASVIDSISVISTATAIHTPMPTAPPSTGAVIPPTSVPPAAVVVPSPTPTPVPKEFSQLTIEQQIAAVDQLAVSEIVETIDALLDTDLAAGAQVIAGLDADKGAAILQSSALDTDRGAQILNSDSMDADKGAEILGSEQKEISKIGRAHV